MHRAEPESNGLDWDRCKEIAREHGRSFFLASQCLPRERRRAIHATYAYCRLADDTIDHAHDGPEAAACQLDWWEEQLDHPTDPVAVAFAEARATYGVPVTPARELIEGLRMDLSNRRYANWDELNRYSYCVAGTVGLLVAPILGCRDPEALPKAATLGIAMQLTNILRDVAEDAERGRLYLPLDEIAAFGCDPDAILAGQPGPRFRELMAFQIDRARTLYAEAYPGVSSLNSAGRLATLTASHFYAGILTEIERLDYDVFQTRARVSTSRKLRAMPTVTAGFVSLSVRPTARAAR
jgi:phytoene synthase